MKQRDLFMIMIFFAAVPVAGARLSSKALTDGDLPALQRAVSDDLVNTHASGWR